MPTSVNDRPARHMRWLGSVFAVGAMAACAVGANIASAAPAYVESTTAKQVVGCESERRVGPGLYVQSFAATNVTGGIGGVPPRATIEVKPGTATTTCVGVINRTGRTIAIGLDAIDVAAGRAGESPIKLARDSPFGSSSWLRLPRQASVRIRHGDILWAVVGIAIPRDASAGSYYSAVEARVIPDKETEGATARIAPAVGVQIFFTIPGEGVASGRLRNVRAPRVIWWDGLDVGRIPFLGRIRGLGIASIRFQWVNTGDYTDEVAGNVVIVSDAGGKDVAQFPVRSTVLLRQATRSFEVTWADDIPLLGRFTPTVEMRGADGKVDRVELDPIWVIPSWLYLIALALAIAIPLGWRRRSRRRYRELEDRVHAAESRHAQEDSGEEW